MGFLRLAFILISFGAVAESITDTLYAPDPDLVHVHTPCAYSLVVTSPHPSLHSFPVVDVDLDTDGNLNVLQGGLQTVEGIVSFRMTTNISDPWEWAPRFHPVEEHERRSYMSASEVRECNGEYCSVVSTTFRGPHTVSIYSKGNLSSPLYTYTHQNELLSASRDMKKVLAVKRHMGEVTLEIIDLETRSLVQTIDIPPLLRGQNLKHARFTDSQEYVVFTLVNVKRVPGRKGSPFGIPKNDGALWAVNLKADSFFNLGSRRENVMFRHEGPTLLKRLYDGRIAAGFEEGTLVIADMDAIARNEAQKP